MATAREMRLRIRSVKNIAQVTRAMQAVSASKVRRAQEAVLKTRPYATRAWDVLLHLANQPGRGTLHPLLVDREAVRSVLVVVVTGDRGLAGAYNTNVIRFVREQFDEYPVPVRYVAVGRKGRDLLLRLKKPVIAEFSGLSAVPEFGDVSAIGHLVVEEFLEERADEVYIVYTDFINMIRQEVTMKRLLPLKLEAEARVQDFAPARQGPSPVYIYEPGVEELLDEIVPRFTALQVYHAILEAVTSEHAARMVAMKNATDNATELAGALRLAYNKARQQSITNELLDIAGGAEALAQALAKKK